MFAEPWNPELYANSFRADDTRDAFCFLVGQAGRLMDYRCHPQQKGAVMDFRFYDAKDELPFAFIPNTKWLLFYLRKPAIRSGVASFDTLHAAFDSASRNGSSEWTVRLRSIADVQCLWKLLKLR